ncbi:MAG: PQQ-binding-like beta-propeller repeat protein [Bacteroidota bacterium]|nr:PQQ-binding-like beta-propeller repeat protein [Bacteroidota bacterium]
MLVAGENLPDEWVEDVNLAWTYEVDGDGWASPVVWGNKVFLATVVAVKINKPGEGEEAGEEGNEDLYLQDLYRWEADICVFRHDRIVLLLYGWGTGSSPLLYNGKLYIQVDNEENSYLVAVAGDAYLFKGDKKLYCIKK